MIDQKSKFNVPNVKVTVLLVLENLLLVYVYGRGGNIGHVT